MTSSRSADVPTSHRSETYWAVWSAVAAFGTYFCMYGFRKPYTSADHAGLIWETIDFKTFLVAAQVIGYTASKFIGIKVISEMTPQRRAATLIQLILIAEASLLLLGLLPRPWNAVALFANGLALGMVFGLVLGFLEGRRVTEALVAGLCTSFVLADGVTKSVGAWLLSTGVSAEWMPFVAGLIFLVPLFVFVGMLAKIPPPSKLDIAARQARVSMNRQERWELFARYAPGLSLIVAIYLLVTIMRSVRADFAPELWGSLGYDTVPSTFALSELVVAIGILLVNGLTIYLVNNRLAFFVSLLVCIFGFSVVGVALLGEQWKAMDAFSFMVLTGFGLYLPYVAIHTTVFERLLAMTEERGNLGFLMYLADAFGYLGYVAVMLSRNLFTDRLDHLEFFIHFSGITAILSLISLAVTWTYFQSKLAKFPTPALAERTA